MPIIKHFFKKAEKEWAFILVLIFYLIIVLHHFQDQGLINWDESYFAIVARTYSDIFKTAIFHPAALFSSSYFSELKNNYGNVYTVAKPSYLMAASFLSLFWPSQLALRLLSIFSGAGTLIIFYKILNFYQIDKKIKVAASLLLASSPLFLLYSRLGLAPMFSAFFLLLSFYYLLKFNDSSRIKHLIISGISLVVLLMSHYSTFIIAGIILAIGLFLIYRKKKSIKIYLTYAASFLALPLAWEIITRCGSWLASKQGISSSDGKFGAWPYSQEFLNQLKLSSEGGSGFYFADPFYYFRMIWSQEGALLFFLFLLGLAIFIKKIKKLPYWTIILTGGIFFLILSLAVFKFPRTLMPVFPLFYLLSAVALAFIDKKTLQFKKPLPLLLLIAICLAVFISHASHYRNILNIQTPFQSFASYIKKNYSPDKTLILSAEAPLWRVYLPGYKIEKINDQAAWVKMTAGKKILATDDYFNWITLPGDSFPDYYSRQIVAEGQTNIFSVTPAIADLFYLRQKEMEGAVANYQNRKIILYEIELKK
jgi:4-amino-4-deoxy-L-arabinose transferase-like glycosyltransferase